MAWLPSLRAQRLLRRGVSPRCRTPGYSARRYAVRHAHRGRGAPRRAREPDRRSGFRGYAVDSQRTNAIRALAETCEHRLFLSATPHNGYSESFTALMEMIDGRRFKRGANLDERALRDIAVRRLKADLQEVKGFQTTGAQDAGLHPGRRTRSRSSRCSIAILAESARRNGRDRSGGIVAMLLKKRFLSSPWSFALTLRPVHRGRSRDRGLETDDEEQYYQEVLGSGQSDEEEGDTAHPEFTALRHSKRSDPLVAATSEDIESLISVGPEVREQAGRAADRADRVPGRHLPSRRHLE